MKRLISLETYALKNEERMKNGEERRKTFTDLLMEHLGSVTEAPRLGFSSRKQFFSPKTAEMHNQGEEGYLEQPLFAYL